MQILQLLIKEMDQEAEITRKMLQLIPTEKFGWKPHEKSMPIEILGVHIAELPSWVNMAMKTTELDFAKMDYKPTPVKDTSEIVALLEQSLKQGKEALQQASEEDLLPEWTLRNGDQVYNVWTKYEVVRHAFAQTIHHRAQLGVYLRLLNIAIPGSYGPSADEMGTF